MAVTEVLSLLVAFFIGIQVDLAVAQASGRRVVVILILLLAICVWPALIDVLAVMTGTARLPGTATGPLNLADPLIRTAYWPLTCILAALLGSGIASLVSRLLQQWLAAGQLPPQDQTAVLSRLVMLSGGVVFVVFTGLAAFGVYLGKIEVARALLLTTFGTGALVALLVVVATSAEEPAQLESAWGGLGGGLGGWRVSRPLVLLGCAGAFGIAAALTGAPASSSGKTTASTDLAGPYKVTVQLEPRAGREVGEAPAPKPPATGEKAGSSK